jgi:hypothetical protein
VAEEPIPVRALRVKLESYLHELFGTFRAQESGDYVVRIGGPTSTSRPSPGGPTARS